jgi:hypothetical protein
MKMRMKPVAGAGKSYYCLAAPADRAGTAAGSHPALKIRLPALGSIGELPKKEEKIKTKTKA